ncbi:MAG: ABC transporter ATP-binding protein [Acidobacteria bacterium]|nr:ABC transporter ATP-binding protein [Acidobacteriota bacterium]
MPPEAAPLLEVEDLRVEFDTPEGKSRAVNGVSFQIQEGETLGLVGESGCGKSLTAMSVLRLITPPGRIASGRILYRGRNLLTVSEPEIRKVRGKEIALIFQEPVAALNPVFTVGDQIAEAIRVHHKVSKKDALVEAARLLKLVQIPDAERRVREYPHQMSGGMCQRVMIAMALSCKPSLIMADEPTTALDVTIQAEILDLLRRLKEEFRLSLLLISHNLGVIAGSADRVAVMYAGRIVELAPVREIFASPKHPYTIGLLRSVPKLGERKRSARRRLYAIPGTVPDPYAHEAGCPFAPRCPDVMQACRREDPRLLPLEGGRKVACFLHHPAHPSSEAATS